MRSAASEVILDVGRNVVAGRGGKSACCGRDCVVLHSAGEIRHVGAVGSDEEAAGGDAAFSGIQDCRAEVQLGVCEAGDLRYADLGYACCALGDSQCLGYHSVCDGDDDFGCSGIELRVLVYFEDKILLVPDDADPVSFVGDCELPVGIYSDSYALSVSIYADVVCLKVKIGERA